MKKFWKALGVAALAAAVIPYRVRKNKAGDVDAVDALLWQAARRPGDAEDTDVMDIRLGFKSPFHEVREERKLFTDDPAEAVPFAGSAPAAPAEPAQPIESVPAD